MYNRTPGVARGSPPGGGRWGKPAAASLLLVVLATRDKKAYVDSRFRTRDSNSDSDFKFELKEALDLPDNTVCYIDMVV